MSESIFDRIGDWVVYKNNQLIAFNKPVNVSVQPDRTEGMSLQQLGSAYAQNQLDLIHRLDRPTSGVVLFAKKKGALTDLNEQFRSGTVGKKYLAIVGARPPKDSGELVNHLKKQGRKNVIETVPAGTEGSKEARLTYKVVGESERYYLLEIELQTGRQHQIRVQLAAIGSPVRGDTKYGFKRANRGGGIDLHAWQLAFDHPVSGERVELAAAPPDTPVWGAFEEYIGSASPSFTEEE